MNESTAREMTNDRLLNALQTMAELVAYALEECDFDKAGRHEAKRLVFYREALRRMEASPPAPEPQPTPEYTDDSCPDCGEDRMDGLVWDEGGEWVTCATCGTSFFPGMDSEPSLDLLRDYDHTVEEASYRWQ